MWRRAAPCVLLLLAGGCLRARGTPAEPVIVALDLPGVKAVDEGELRAKLATRASGRSAWGDVWRLDPDALSSDQRRIVAFYKEHGYYRAAVEKVEVVPDGDGRVRVSIHVREGDPVRVTRVDVEGLEAAPEARARTGKLPLEPGKIFTWAAFDAARAQIQAALGVTGYATGTVTQAAHVSADQGTAEVTYRVEAGPRYRFGAISIAGATVVPVDKVATQAARQVRPGDWYDERQLEVIQKRVFQLGVFSGVRVTRGTPDLEQRTMPLVITVSEAPFRTLRLGPSIGFQAARWDVQGLATWTHRNWLGDLRKLQLDAEGGYAWIPNPIDVTREGVVGKVSAGFTQPSVFFDAVDVATSVELEKSLDQAYGSISEKIRFGLPYRPAPRWTIVPSYNIEFYQLRDVVGGTNPDLEQFRNCPNGVCFLSYLEQRVSWDGRDNPLVTTDGLYLSLSVQEGFKLGSHGYTYLRFIPEVRSFKPLGSGSVLAARARVGALVPIGEADPAPVVALFTAGGPGSMRGYGVERLSPMVLQDGTWVPIGGNGVIEASVELRRTLHGNLVGAVFLDAGNVSDASGSGSEFSSVFDPSKLQLAIGVGIRYRTPVGPFRADLGCRLPTNFGPGVPFEQRFPAVPGNSGHHEPIVALHVTLGEAY